MAKIRKGINFVIGLLKWPLAVLMLLALVPALRTDLDLLKSMGDMHFLVFFFGPMLGAALLFFISGLSGSFLIIAEHELTHMLLAVLTFHRPRGLDISQGVGGYFAFSGEGNWMIALAPYFFPTFALVVMLGTLFTPMEQGLSDVFLIVLGSMIGYHIVATVFEVHPQQTDFKVAGYLFTICFLPGINLIVYGLLFGFAKFGWQIFPLYFNALLLKSQGLLHQLTML